MRACVSCGRPIIGRRVDALYCCDECRDIYHYRTRIQPARAALRICPRHPERPTPLPGRKQRICAGCRMAHRAIKAANQRRWRLAQSKKREAKAFQQLQ